MHKKKHLCIIILETALETVTIRFHFSNDIRFTDSKESKTTCSTVDMTRISGEKRSTVKNR